MLILAALAATHLIGWPAGPATSQELLWERIFATVPSAAAAANIEQHISSKPHRAGTPADYATAQFVQQRLQADGFQTRVVPYDLAFTAPVAERLEMMSPRHVAFDLLEGTPGHHSAAEIAAGPPFSENSGDGNVTGNLYYVNNGSPADLTVLDAMHVDLRGAIVLIRNFGGSYDELRKRGVAGILTFVDPADDGYGRGDVWPYGNFKNIDMAERGGGIAPAASPTPLPPGDVTLPGQAPLPGIAHHPWNSVPRPDIPELPVTQRSARALLAAMAGAVVPREWHPLFEIVVHTGGNVRVHLAVQMSRRVVRTWNVIGALTGSENPNSIVMIGSHRDAMVFGAIDPGSGTTALLQVADGLHALAARGWRPQRTIEIASWDGHELGLFGSISYAYQFDPQLRSTLWQYINTDQTTTGNPFAIRASPGLWEFLKQIADVVPGPDALMLSAHDAPAVPLLNPPASGSDHQTFAYMLGIPSSSNGFRGVFGAHHTAEDNIAGIKTYDPGFKEAVSDTILTGIQAMRTAGGAVAPLRMSDHAQDLLTALKLGATSTTFKPGVDITALQNALTEYLDAARATDGALDAAESNGNLAAMQSLSAKEQAAFSAFYIPAGLSTNPYLHTIDRAPNAFPEITNGATAPQQQAAVDRLVAAVQEATAALR